MSEFSKASCSWAASNKIKINRMTSIYCIHEYNIKSHGMASYNFLAFSFVVLVCRFCTLDADWFAAPAVFSSHHIHMLDQWTGTSGAERFGTLICLYKRIRQCHIVTMPKNFWFRHAFVSLLLPPNAIFFHHAEYTNGLFIFYWFRHDCVVSHTTANRSQYSWNAANNINYRE